MKRKVITDTTEFALQNSIASLPYSEDVTCLGEQVAFGKWTAANRLVCQAMEGCDGTADGSIDTLTRRRYHRLAKSGTAIIWFEATACCEEGRANPRQLWLREDNLDSFKHLLDEIRELSVKENGFAPLIIMQDTHSGRYSKPHGVPEPKIAYHATNLEATPLSDSCLVTDDHLDWVKEQLIHGAALAQRAGFDGVDIKCCHRYLNSELLSAYTRPGRYGGSLENRTRLLRECISGAMEICDSDFLVTSRLNVYDGFAYPLGFGVAEGRGTEFDPTEPVWLLRQLEKLGVPLLDITMGNPYFNPHVNRPFVLGAYTPEEHPIEGVARMLRITAQLKQAVPGIKLVSSGLTYLGAAAPQVAAGFIGEGGFDFAGFGRTILAYPDFAKDILQKGAMEKDKLCICCSKCSELMRNGQTPGCVVRDSLYTQLYKDWKQEVKA